MSTARPEWDYWKHKPRWARFPVLLRRTPSSAANTEPPLATFRPRWRCLIDPSSTHPEYNVRFGIRRISSVAITASGSPPRAFCAWASPRLAEYAGCGSKGNIREGQVR